MCVIAGEISSFTRVVFVSENPCVAGSIPALTTPEMPPILVATRFAAFFCLLIQLAEDAAADVKGMGRQVVALSGPDDFDDEK